MRHCNSVFSADDIWFLIDNDQIIKRKIYIASCPICGKNIALYSYYDENAKAYNEKYYYSNGANKIKERFKKDVVATMLGFKYKYKSPSGFKFGINKLIKKNGKEIGSKQYACDFSGNKILIKTIYD